MHRLIPSRISKGWPPRAGAGTKASKMVRFGLFVTPSENLMARSGAETLNMTGFIDSRTAQLL